MQSVARNLDLPDQKAKERLEEVTQHLIKHRRAAGHWPFG